MTTHPGDSGAVTVTLVRGGGFNGPVSVTVTGFPAGVTATVTPSTLTLTTSQAQVSVRVADTVSPGTYAGTVSASAAGVSPASAAYSVVVSERPNFTLSTGAATVSIHQGASATTEIRIDRTNFTGGVMLALQDPPAGITGTFSQSPSTGLSASLALSVAATVAPGSYTLKVVGSAPGHVDKTVSLTIAVSPKPDYSLTITPGTLSISAGSSGQAAISIDRTNFTEAVALALVNPPAGITGTFTPPSTTGTSATLDVTVVGTVAPGNYALSVIGTSASLSARTTTLTISVAPQAAYTLSLSSGSITAIPGATAQVTVHISRTNFAGVVSLSLVNAPAGVTGTFTPASTSGTSATLVISVGGNATPGSYPLTVVGSSPGYADRSTSAGITVEPRPDFTFSVVPAAVTLNAGSGRNLTINITRTNFSGTVFISMPSVPVGGIQPVGTMGFTSGNSVDVPLVVDYLVPGGTYTLTLVGSATGVSGTKTTTLSLTVIGAPPDFTLAMSPVQTGSHQGGGTMGFSVLVTRISNTAPVTLTVDPVPVGMSVQLSQSVVTGPLSVTQVIGSITIPPNTTPGTYTVTIRGTAPGLSDKMATLSVIVTNDPPPDFLFSPLPGSLNISAGTSANTSLLITRINYTGVPITFSVESAPPGLTGTLNPTVATGSSATLQVAVAPGVSPGTYTMRIKAAANDAGIVITRTRDVTVVVPSANAFSLSLPAQRTFGQMTTGQIPVTITRTNFTGSITLTLENAPAGMTGFFGINPSQLQNTQSLLNLTIGVNVPAGTYTLTVRGTSPGQADQTASVQVTVYVNFTLSSSSDVLVYPGGTGTSTITLNRGNFVGDVQLYIQNPQPWITSSFSPAVLSGSTTTSTLTLTSPAGYVGSEYLIVNGQSGSVLSQVLVNFSSRWTQFLQFPTVSPNPVVVSQGSSSATTLTVYRNNYYGPFTIAVTGAPSGMTVSVGTQPVPGGSSSTTLTISVGANVPVGTYTLAVQLSATGVQADSMTFPVQVKQ